LSRTSGVARDIDKMLAPTGGARADRRLDDVLGPDEEDHSAKALFGLR
jgi:hypothetical protein